MPFFEVRGLTRRPWFEDFDLALEEGEIVVLRGPTGSGKTLMLRALADLDPADEGEVLLEGKERDEVVPREWRASVLYLHQTPVRLQGDVRANLEPVERLALNVKNGVAGTAIPGLLPDQDAASLSGGEAQLMALERALMLEPKVLLLDEPTAALDPASARSVEARVREWVRSGHAVLWVAHDPEIAARIGARTEAFP